MISILNKYGSFHLQYIADRTYHACAVWIMIQLIIIGESTFIIAHRYYIINGLNTCGAWLFQFPEMWAQFCHEMLDFGEVERSKRKESWWGEGEHSLMETAYISQGKHKRNNQCFEYGWMFLSFRWDPKDLFVGWSSWEVKTKEWVPSNLILLLYKSVQRLDLPDGIAFTPPVLCSPLTWHLQSLSQSLFLFALSL